MDPLVSVIIPSYNQEKYLIKAVQSVLQQTYSPIEKIIIDDGSTDNSLNLIEALAKNHSNIKIIKQQNQGPSSARNKGIKFAEGTIISFLDSDDLIEPNKITLQVEAFKANPEIDIIYTAYKIIDQNDELLKISYSQDYPPELFLAEMFFRNIVGPGEITARRECVLQHPFDEHLRHAEDYEWLLRLAHHCHFKYLNEPLTSYRRHESNVSYSLQSHRISELEILRKYGMEHILKAVDQAPISIDKKRLMKGKNLFNLEHYHDAILYLQDLQMPLAGFYLGNCHMQLGDFFNAIASYQTSLNLNDKKAETHNNLGVAFVRTKDFSQAKKCFENAATLNPDYIDAEVNLQNLNAQNFTWKELRKTLLPYRR